MFVSSAAAQTGGAPGSQGMIEFLLPLVLIFVVFYFLLIRPQQKKAKEHKEMVENIRRGDRVVTSGGIRGKVAKVLDDGFISIEVSSTVVDKPSDHFHRVRVDVLKATIADVLEKTDRDSNDKKKNKKKERKNNESEDLEDEVNSDGA